MSDRDKEILNRIYQKYYGKRRKEKIKQKDNIKLIN